MGTLETVSDLAIQLSESGRDWLIHRPVDIAIYVVLALAVRYLLHRAIDRLVQGAKRTEPTERSRHQWWAFLRRDRDLVQDARRIRSATRADANAGRSVRRPSGPFSNPLSPSSCLSG